MKHLKKFPVLLIALVVALSMSVMTAYAATSHSITIKNTNSTISIDGKTYNAYKLFDSTHSGDAYAYTLSTDSQFYDATLVSGTPTGMYAVMTQYFTFTAATGTTAYVNVTPKSNSMSEAEARAFADAMQPFLASKTVTASATASGETATIALADDEAGQGYYLVTGDAKATDENAETDTVVSAVILTNEDPSAQIQPKAGIPTLDKKITAVKEAGTAIPSDLLDDKGKAAVAKVGYVVEYQLDSIVPDLTGYTDYTFMFSDSITAGLTYNKDSKLTINGTEVSIAPSYASDNKSFTLTIPYNTLKQYSAGNPIVLTYSATVNDSALTYNYEANTANLTYSHSPYDDTTNKTPDKKTYVIDLNLDVVKIGNGDETNTLDGAEFKLYRLVDGAEQYYKWADNKVTWVAKDAGDTFVTDTNGNLTQQVRGLDKGEYYLLETKAPTGYNLMLQPVKVVISAVENTNDVTYTATYGSESATVTNGVVDLSKQTEAQPVAIGAINNESGTVLPSTGGMGTTILYVVGGIMIVVAAAFLVGRRRASKNDESEDLM